MKHPVKWKHDCMENSILTEIFSWRWCFLVQTFDVDAKSHIFVWKKIVNINVVVYSLRDAIALHCLVGCYGKIKNLNCYFYVYMVQSMYYVDYF